LLELQGNSRVGKKGHGKKRTENTGKNFSAVDDSDDKCAMPMLYAIGEGSRVSSEFFQFALRAFACGIQASDRG